MQQNFTFLETSYTPVPPVYFDVIASEKEKAYTKVFFFGIGTDLEEASGKITGIEKTQQNEEFLCFDSGDRARLDRIITINGKPGPAYDEYDRYALACLDCGSGMD